MLVVCSNDRHNHPECDYTTSAIDVHRTFLHADIDQQLFAEPPEESQLYEDQVWKLHSALYGYRKAPKLFTSTNMFVALLANLNFRPLLTDPSCFRTDRLL